MYAHRGAFQRANVIPYFYAKISLATEWPKIYFSEKNWVFRREIITRTINNLKYICENQHLPGKVFIKKLVFFLFFFYRSLLAGNFTVEKKVCTFELCLALIKKYSKSFGGKNLASSTRFFSHRKLRIYFVLILDYVQIRRNFFPFGNPPYAKKSKRDSLHFDLLPGPLNSADFFTCTVNKRQERINMQYKFF